MVKVQWQHLWDPSPNREVQEWVGWAAGSSLEGGGARSLEIFFRGFLADLWEAFGWVGGCVGPWERGSYVGGFFGGGSRWMNLGPGEFMILKIFYYDRLVSVGDPDCFPGRRETPTVS